MIYPGLNIYKRDAEKFRVVPVYEEIRAEFESPLGIFKKSDSQFFLESVERGENVGRYSIVAGGCLLEIVLKGDQIETVLNTGNGYKRSVETVPNPFDEAAKRFKDYNCPEYQQLPPFYSGIIGFLGYEAVSYFSKLGIKENRTDIPDGMLTVPEHILVYDSVKRTLTIIISTLTDSDLPAEDLYSAAVKRIGAIKADITGGRIENEPVSDNAEGSERMSEGSGSDKDLFMEKVVRCKEYIRNGDIIQAVLSRTEHYRTAVDPLSLYQSLRILNPSPYMFYMDYGGFCITGSSPEVMVKVQGDEVMTKPIAGTRGRGQSPDEDRRLESELLADPKERAEHLMLVDLARNDIGRISVSGSVDVNDFMNVERYSHVMHIVSTVIGKLEPKYDGFDVIRAVFPAGTLSGAPKLRAMEIVDELEGKRRGPYGGMVFYLGFNGNLDSCITIRTVVFKDGIARLQAGAGIVIDSDPEAEFEETRKKLGALKAAFSHADSFESGGKHDSIN